VWVASKATRGSRLLIGHSGDAGSLLVELLAAAGEGAILTDQRGPNRRPMMASVDLGGGTTREANWLGRESFQHDR
jgi:hypothetical protein